MNSSRLSRVLLKSLAFYAGASLGALCSSALSAKPCGPLALSEAVKESGSLSYVERSPVPELPESPIVIALHGLGHHKEGFSRLAAQLPAAWRVISVDAPWRYGSGFAWYRFRCPQAEADLAESTQRLLKLSRALSQRYPKAPKPALFGFSQGGVMSLSALDASPERWSALGSLSGYWLPQRAPRPAPAIQPTLLLAHGAQDRVVPFSRGQRAAGRLSDAGYAVHWLPFEGRHTVSQRALEALIEAIKAGLERLPRVEAAP